MTPRLAILCPGQGAQHPAMFDLARSEPDTAAAIGRWLFDAGEPVAQAPLDELLAHPSAMFDNRSAQPLVVAASLAAWRVLAPRLPRPSLVAGYSVGEVSAYAVAGAFPIEQAVAIAARRAEIMSSVAARGGEQGMAAVSGLAPEALSALLAQSGCEAAIDLPASTIAGGPAAGLLRLQALATSAGGHYTPLPINVASHTSLLRDAVAPLRALFASQAAAPALPLLAGIRADAVHGPDDAADLLARQAMETIRWTDCLDAIAESRIDVALELGPGNALSRMLRERHPGIACRSLADFRSVKGVAAWIEAQA
jgi:[acyl-carrier-protein] S-malonyltransferase